MGPKSERFEMRIDAELLVLIDEWRALQRPIPSRAEAIRTLAEKAATEDLKQMRGGS